MSQTRLYFIKLGLLSAAYTAVVYLSLFLVPAGGSGASLIWPPSALAMTALFLFGPELWPALLVPFFFLLLMRGINPATAAAVASGDMLEALGGAYLMRRFGFNPLMARLQDALVFILAAFVPTLISATLITGALHFFGTGGFQQSLWVGLWIGHTVSLISFGPFFMRWAYKPTFSRTRAEWIEGVLVFGLIAVVNFFLYWTHHGTLGPISLLYVAIIPLIWAALRTGPRGMSLGLAIMSSLAVGGLFFGSGAFSHTASVDQTILSLQLVLGVLSLIFLLFSAIVEERKDATNSLRSNVDQLEVALEQIRSEDQAKSDFIAILAHELRNPLSPILSSLEWVKLQGPKPENVEAVSSIASHVHVMARLLDDLLDLSRVSQKKFKIQLQTIKLSDIVAQSLEMARPILKERDHTLTVSQPAEELWLDADPVRVGQIFTNLLTNAAKYTDPGGKIRFVVSREGDRAKVEVSDTGIGIEPARLGKIFEPFAEADSTRRAGGLHIGLSLAKRMTELHHGKLEVHSPGEGRGSTFVVRLPLMPTSPLLQTAENKTRSRFSRDALRSRRELGSLRVLIVDDNEAAADSLCKLMEHNGHRPFVAYSGEEALRLIEGEELQVALLDIGLPGMDGYELGARLRAQFGNDLRMVALTGYGQADDKEKARNAGFDEHLTKPVSIVDIERVLLELGKNH